MAVTRARAMTTTAAAIAAGMLYLPMLAVAAASFNASRNTQVWKGFTLDWYSRLVGNDAVLAALRNTLILAVISTAIATVIGTLMALGMARFPWPKAFRSWLESLLHLPIVTPDIIFAAALVVAFRILRDMTGYFELGIVTMVLSHVTFQTAFVTLVVRSRIVTLGPEIDEAAHDLYASRWYLLRRITLPLLAPGIVAGALLALVLSLDDFVISFFTAGPGSTTVPIYIHASVKRGISPELHALSTLMFAATLLLVLVLQALSMKGGTRRLPQQDIDAGHP